MPSAIGWLMDRDLQLEEVLPLSIPGGLGVTQEEIDAFSPPLPETEEHTPPPE